MAVLAGQAERVRDIDRYGFAAVWVRDVPLVFDPAFGDAEPEVFDPFTYLAFLAAHTPLNCAGNRQCNLFVAPSH